MRKMKYDTKKTGLVVIDMQNEFARLGGAIYVPQAKEQIPLIADLADFCRDNSVRVIYTKVVWDNDAELPSALLRGMAPVFLGNRSVLRRGLEGEKIVEALKPKNGDRIVEKKYFDAFHNTDFDENAKGLENLAFVGTTVNNCVYSSMLAAAHRGYRPIAIKDGISGFNEEHREFFLNPGGQMEAFLGADVITADEFKKRLQ